MQQQQFHPDDRLPEVRALSLHMFGVFQPLRYFFNPFENDKIWMRAVTNNLLKILSKCIKCFIGKWVCEITKKRIARLDRN